MIRARILGSGSETCFSALLPDHPTGPLRRRIEQAVLQSDAVSLCVVPMRETGDVNDWPLIGRERELTSLLGELRSSVAGVVLAGPAGVGKTRLAEEAVAALGARGVTAIRVAATQSASRLPFGPYATLLPEVAPGLDRVEMLRQVTAAVLQRCEEQSIILRVDDAHLLDEASAILTHQLATSRRVRLLVTLRSGEPAPAAVLALWKEGLARRIDVEPLHETEVERLLAAVLGGPVESATRRRLFDRSAGNVLFLRELVVGALQSGALQLEDGLWRMNTRLVVSTRLTELVEARLGELSEEDRHPLEVLAAGEPLGVDLLGRLIGANRLRVLTRRGLIRTERDGRRVETRLSHPLYSEVLRSERDPLTARNQARELATAIESVGARRRTDLLFLATLQLESGDTTDARLMVSAAQRAWALHDHELAGRLAAAASEAGGGLEADLLQAQVLSLSGRAEEAEHRLAALATVADEDTSRARLAIARVDLLCYSLGRVDEALQVAEAAERTMSERAWREELTAYRASLLDASGQTNAAVELAAPLAEHGTGRGQIWACALAAFGYIKQGRFTKALEACERGRTQHLAWTGEPLPWGTSLHAALKCLALAYRGSITEAAELARGEYEEWLSTSRGPEWLPVVVLARINHLQGRVATAARRAREAASLARQHGRLTVVRPALSVLAESLALAGRAEEAEKALNELESLPAPVTWFWSAEAEIARAWIRVATGDLAGGRQALADAVVTAAQIGDLVSEATALHDLARVGRPADAVDRLEELATHIEGPLTRARAAHARALTSKDPSALESAAATFFGLGAMLLAAEAAADAAAAWSAAEHQRMANAAKRRAAEIHQRCEGAVTPALTAAHARATLTTRQLEVARLAAAGLPNRDIAGQLHLSQRTVENYLHAAYERLGVSGRQELEELFREPPRFDVFG